MATYLITELEPLPKDVSTLAGFFNNNSIIVGASDHRATYWSPAPSLLPVGNPNAFGSANAINEAGDIVGGWLPDKQPGDQAFLFRNGTFHDLASVFGADTSAAWDINDGGIITGEAGKFGARHAFRYDSQKGKVLDLGVLPGHDQSGASAINIKGQITGTSGNNVSSHAFLWDGKLVDLGAATNSSDINDSGVIVGARYFPGASEATAFLYASADHNPQFQDLGPLSSPPGFVRTVAYAINTNGDVVGMASTKPGPGQMQHAIVRKAGGLMQDLNSLIPPNSGWMLKEAVDINDKGEIVGTGILNGNYRGFWLTPVSPFEGINRYYQAIDPMALILPSSIYPIWAEMRHPHEPKVSEIKQLLQSMAPAERTAMLNRARRFVDIGKTVEKAFQELKE